MAKQYETVIGLEVHVELATSTKIFCGCSTKFGAAPNTHTCPVCTGMPGSLPVLNGKVVEYALKLADALSCQVNRYSRFDRKNYFYPDNPQNYQISQLYLPILAIRPIIRKPFQGPFLAIRPIIRKKPSGSMRCTWRKMRAS